MTCLVSEADTLVQSLTRSGLTVKPISLEGRFHSPALNSSFSKLLDFCGKYPDVQLPSADNLRIPLRSNSNAQVLSQGSLHHIILKSILTEVADWHLTLSSACYQSNLVDHRNLLALSIGLVDAVSHASAVELNLEVTRIRNSALLLHDLCQPEPAEHTQSESTRTAKPPPKDGPYSDEAIAVVGMACKFPGADSVQEFWDILVSGISMHSEVPQERFSTKDNRRSPGKTYFGNFIRDVDAFDHRFFKKSSREAASTDPQQRLLLQVAYQALESAGEFGVASRHIEDTGCYVGVCGNDYNDNVATHDPNAFSTLGTLRAFLTGKISHYFGWTGPSITYDTACSSSAVAIHAACQALQMGECSRAVAGGVSLYTSPYFYQNLAAASFLSPTGPTKSFDAAADGYCRGEGAGLVVLKKLSSAIAAEDEILGVISASAVNQCSNTVPITVPHSPSQAKLFRKLLAMAHVAPADVSFVEAHGTGTPVGDPLEFESIKNVFGGTPRSNTIYVGSVKANIGHTEGASGIAALIKTLLMMKHKMIPMQANFNKLNPKIAVTNPGIVAIPTNSQRWDSASLVACVNNYGAGGSIAAMIVCEPPRAELGLHTQLSTQTKYPILVTAKSPSSFRTYCTALRKSVAQQLPTTSSGTLLANVSFALAHKQNLSFPHLLSTTVGTLAEFDDLLRALGKENSTVPSATSERKPVILAFGGQTSRFVGLSRETYHASSLLRSHLDHCDSVSRSLGYEGLYPNIFMTDAQENIITLHAMQFALQYSCAMVWLDCGLKVDRLIGHSFGQLVALTVSGSLSLVDGLRLVCGRASLIRQHWGSESGAMLALEADVETVSELMNFLQSSGHNIEIACYNAPRSHVLVGAQRAIAAVEQRLAQLATQKIKFKTLNVTHGFHSAFVDPILPGLAQLAESLAFKKPTIPLETCSDKHSWTNLEPKLIVEHSRTPVYFGQAVKRISQQCGPCTWIEAGSNSSITAMVRRALSAEDSTQHAFHTVNLCKQDAMGSLAETIVDLWKGGSKVQFWPFHRSQRTALGYFDPPPYQFEKTRHWLEWSEPSQALSNEPSALAKEEQKPRILSFVRFCDQTRYDAEFLVDPRSEQYRLFVGGHRVLAQPLFPAPLYIELVAQAAFSIESSLDIGNAVFSVEGLEIKAPLGSNPELKINLLLNRHRDTRGTGLRWSFTFYSQVPTNVATAAAKVQEHASGTIILRPAADLSIENEFIRYERLVGQSRCADIMASQAAEAMQGSLIYKVFSKVVHYSEYYEGVRRVSSKDGEVSGLVTLPDHDLDAINQTVCNPLAIDNFIQVAGLHVNSLNTLGDNEVYVCTHVDRVQPSLQYASGLTTDRSWSVFSNFTSNGQKEVTNDIFIFESNSQKLVFIILGARFQRVVMNSLAKVLSRANSTASLAQLAPVAESDPVLKLSAKQTDPKKRDLEGKRIQETKKALNSLQTPKVLKIEKDLRQLLSKITDVPVDAFKDESTLEELGIDSLMVMEITLEIRQTFNVDIPQSDLPDLTTFKKTTEYICSKLGVESARIRPREDINTTPCNSSSSASNAPPAPADDQDLAHEDASLQKETVERLARILAGHLEISASKFEEDTNLADQGLDSLLCIELASDIMESFGITIDITQLNMESTFGDLCNMITNTTSATLSPSSTRDSSSEPTTMPNSPSIAAGDIASGDHTEKPSVLVGAQQTFNTIRYDYDKFTKETGFFDFWKLVYPSQAELVLAYVVEAFSQLGCSLTSMRTGDRIPEVNILPKHSKLGLVLYDILQDASLIEWTGAYHIRSEKPIGTTPASTLYQNVLSAHPQHACEHELLNITGSKLAQLLTGAADPLQLLFGSKRNRDLLEEVYSNGPMYEAITKLLGTFLSTVFGDQKPGHTFHLLELGGGTGGTTKHVLEVLSRSGVSFTYTFTDLSPQLVAAAKRKFAKYDFMDFMAVNVEKAPPAQLLNRFHIILSTNCIHATRNLESSLSNIRQMLRADGFVSLVEFTKNIFWFDLVFGLLEGWWFFEDGRQHVLADGAFWEKSMRAAGFKYVTMTDGTSLESRTLRIITGFAADCENPDHKVTAITTKSEMPLETIAWKVTKDNVLLADIYYPEDHASKPQWPVGNCISIPVQEGLSKLT